ncbi:AAA family ATPase [Candidatus Woesearchaeota archaeon]|nr:AAA family ATPase [Candidatus Woesearchaeota archaeon]
MVYYVIIRGPLGIGKSTIAKSLSEKIKAKHISIDRIIDTFKKEWVWEDGYISQKTFIHGNELIVPEAKTFLETGKVVVFDGNFYHKSQVDDLIKRLKFSHYVFTLTAPLEVCIARDVERGKTHGEDAARAVYKKSTKFTYGTQIDATKPLDKCIREIISYLPSN